VIGRVEAAFGNKALGVTALSRLPEDDTFWASAGFAPEEGHGRPSARPTRLVPFWVRLLAACSKSVETWFVDHEFLPVPPSLKAEGAYLEWIREDLKRKNVGGLVYVPLGAAYGPTGEAPSDEWSPFGAPDPHGDIRRIRQLLWVLSGEAQGGDQASAQLAAAN